MSDEYEFVPQEKGNLIPPSRRPPTAVGASTPEPPDLPRSLAHLSGRRVLGGAFQLVRMLVSRGMDVVDELLDPVVAKLHGPRSAAGRNR